MLLNLLNRLVSGTYIRLVMPPIILPTVVWYIQPVSELPLVFCQRLHGTISNLSSVQTVDVMK